MKYQKNIEINDKKFLRLTAIERVTFNKMLNILKEFEIKKRLRGGRKNKLLLEDRILMTLEYWREYRTYFHIADSYGISESTCFRNIKWVEDNLLKHSDFQQIDGKKSLLNDNFKDKTIIIDVTESTIQRPKKDKNNIILEKRKNIQ